MNTVAHARAILNALEAAGLTVGDGERPKSIPANPSDAGWHRYSMFFFQPGGEVSGNADDPDSDFDGRFAIVSVGASAAEARFESDRAKDALTTGFGVAGRSIQRVRQIGATPQPGRDDDVSPPIFTQTRRYGFWSFPS